MDGHRFGVAVVASAASAAAATIALRPRRGLTAAKVEATAYFSATELDRARAYARPRRRLALAETAVTGSALAAATLRPPGPLRAALSRAARRPLLGSAVTGAALSLVLTALELPFGVVAERRARRFGLSTQRWRGWAGDVTKASGIGALLSAPAAAIAVALARRFPGRWWGPASAASTAVGGVFTLLAPVLLDPLFNRYTPLSEGALRSEVLELAGRAGVDVGEVYRTDASRRTTAANAYVAGLGKTKRVVLFDTLMDEFSADELRSVVAHELAHVKHRDLVRALAWLALVMPGAALAIERLIEWVEPRSREPGPELVLAAALASPVVASWLAIAAAALSRGVEARADAFALAVTRDPEAFISLERRLTTQNLSDPDPPRWVQLLLASHPPAIERIGYAVHFAGAGSATS